MGGIIFWCGSRPQNLKVALQSVLRMCETNVYHLYLQTNIVMPRIVSFSRILFVTCTRNKTFSEETERRRNISADVLAV